MKKYLTIVVVLFCIPLMGADGCNQPQQPKSTSGISKAEAKVTTGSDGLTTEQRNIKNRVEMENKPGQILHLYLISPMTGKPFYYSTVDGKITSSGKRLTAKTVTWSGNHVNRNDQYNFNGDIFLTKDKMYLTNEMIQDDGTYGDSISYLYFWDVQGRYHQIYVSGGTQVIMSDQPITAFNDVVLQFENDKNE